MNNEKPTKEYIFENQLEEEPEELEDENQEEEIFKQWQFNRALFKALSVENKEFLTNREKPEIPIKVANVFKPYYTDEELIRVEDLTNAYYDYVKNNDQIPISFIMASNNILNEIEEIHRLAQERYLEENKDNFGKVLADTTEALKEINKTFCNELVNIYRNIMSNIFGQINWDNATLNGEYLEIRQSDIASPMIIIPGKPVDESKRKKAPVIKVNATVKSAEKKAPIKENLNLETDPIHYFKSDRTVSLIGIMELLRLPKNFYAYYEYMDLERQKNLYIDPNQLGLDLEETEPDYIVFRDNILGIITKALNNFYPKPKKSTRKKKEIEDDFKNTSWLDLTKVRIPYAQEPALLSLTTPNENKLSYDLKRNIYVANISQDAVLLMEQQNNFSLADTKLLLSFLAKFVNNLDMRHATDSEIEKNRKMVITLKEYMSLMGLNDRKSAKQQMLSSIATLDEAKIQVKNYTVYEDVKLKKDGKTTTVRKPVQTDINIKLSGATAISSRGKVEFHLNRDYADLLRKQGNVGQLRTDTFKISNRKPTAFYLSNKIQYTYEIGDKKRHPYKDHLTVKTLLDACGSSIPKYEDIKNTGQIRDRIITPLSKGLNELLKNPQRTFYEKDTTTKCEQPLLNEWYYIDKETKERLTPLKYNQLTYNEFINLTVFFEMDLEGYKQRPLK